MNANTAGRQHRSSYSQRSTNTEFDDRCVELTAAHISEQSDKNMFIIEGFKLLMAFVRFYCRLPLIKLSSDFVFVLLMKAFLPLSRSSRGIRPCAC